MHHTPHRAECAFSAQCQVLAASAAGTGSVLEPCTSVLGQYWSPAHQYWVSTGSVLGHSMGQYWVSTGSATGALHISTGSVLGQSLEPCTSVLGQYWVSTGALHISTGSVLEPCTSGLGQYWVSHWSPAHQYWVSTGSVTGALHISTGSVLGQSLEPCTSVLAVGVRAQVRGYGLKHLSVSGRWFLPPPPLPSPSLF